MAKGMVRNVSNNPLALPDGRMIGPGETVEDFDESSLAGDLFFQNGWLVTGKEAKALQGQLDNTESEVTALQAQVSQLQSALEAETLRANEATAKAENASPERIAELESQVQSLTAERDQLKADASSKAKK